MANLPRSGIANIVVFRLFVLERGQVGRDVILSSDNRGK